MMRSKLLLMVGLILFSGLILTPSCTVTDPTFGTLTVTVYDPVTGIIVADEEVYLATSLDNLKAGIYLKTGWTGSKGSIYFGDLPPAFYYFDTARWEDYGAAQVYAGIDQYVILYVNTPAAPKK
jgi:hypothetical protein